MDSRGKESHFKPEVSTSYKPFHAQPYLSTGESWWRAQPTDTGAGRSHGMAFSPQQSPLGSGLCASKAHSTGLLPSALRCSCTNLTLPMECHRPKHTAVQAFVGTWASFSGSHHKSAIAVLRGKSFEFYENLPDCFSQCSHRFISLPQLHGALQSPCNLANSWQCHCLMKLILVGVGR